MGKLISLDAALTMFEANENLPTQSVRSLLRQIPAIDLAAAQPAQVRVKPLHEKANDLLKAATELSQLASYSEIVGGIAVNRPQIRKWCDEISAIIRELPEDENYEPTLIAALEPQPDPRDEVIARLVEAADAVDNDYISQQWGPEIPSIEQLRAAIAAAKAVQP